MRRMLIGAAAVGSLLTTSAFAADLPVKTYTKAPVYVAPVYNWTGFYLGGNIGYSWGKSSDTSTLTNPSGMVVFTSAGQSNLDGGVGGGQIGYNWQMQGWVWGFEADIQGSGENGSRAFAFQRQLFVQAGLFGLQANLAVPFALTQKIDWFGTVRGRVGVLATPKVLLYATGGLAYGEVNSSEAIGVATPVSFLNTTTNVGWTVGAGVEGAIGGNWTARLEYLYVDLGRTSGSFVTPVVIGFAVNGGFLNSNYSSRITDNILRVGVNYKFDGSGAAR
jgi:outer membrane immunogenic protein